MTQFLILQLHFIIVILKNIPGGVLKGSEGRQWVMKYTPTGGSRKPSSDRLGSVSTASLSGHRHSRPWQREARAVP
jgi:hypothetical protein